MLVEGANQETFEHKQHLNPQHSGRSRPSCMWATADLHVADENQYLGLKMLINR